MDIEKVKEDLFEQLKNNDYAYKYIVARSKWNALAIFMLLAALVAFLFGMSLDEEMLVIASIVFAIAGIIGFITSYITKKNRVKKLRDMLITNQSLEIQMLYQINQMYGFPVIDKSSIQKLEEFLNREENKEIKKLKKYFKSFTPDSNTGALGGAVGAAISVAKSAGAPNRLSEKIESLSGIKVEVPSIIGIRTKGAFEVGGTVFYCYFLNDKQSQYEIKVKNMIEDCIISIG